MPQLPCIATFLIQIVIFCQLNKHNQIYQDTYIICLTRISRVCINLDREGRPAISRLPPRGILGNGHVEGNALLLEFYMFTFSRQSHVTRDPLRLASFLTNFPYRTGLRCMNMNQCPHCIKNGRLDLIERLNEWGPTISRSDGENFHLVLGDRPLEYPAERSSGKSEMKSVGFWYLHEANGGSTETVVVILRRPPTGEVSLLRHLELVADKLFDKLHKSSRLPCLYEFDGHNLHQIHT